MDEELKNNQINEERLNCALGCVIGAFIGDALGSAIEFKKYISPEELAECLEMNGGVFGNGPGQVTDDSELGMSLLKGLVDTLPYFSEESIVKYYKDWISSGPFDIGTTTRNALDRLRFSSRNNAYLVQAAKNAALYYNKDSESNGSFMRSSPLAVWCRKLSIEDIEKAVVSDVSFTHSNLTVQKAETYYIVYISHLIQNPQDIDGAEEAAERYLNLYGNNELQDWVNDAKSKRKMYGFPNMGHAKIAFDHSFKEIRKKPDNFENVMMHILSIGGDTDTNACIVGAMVGAYIGYNKLPQKWKDKVENFDSNREGIRRPEFLNQKEVKDLVIRLFNGSPDRFEQLDRSS